MAKQVLLLFTTCLITVKSYDIHKYMNIDELRRTFHVDHHSLVPEYEVVHIHHINRRSVAESSANNILDGVYKGANSFNSERDKSNSKVRNKETDSRILKFSAFGEPVQLNLTRNNVLLKKGGLKLWTVEPNATAQHGVEYVEIPSEEDEYLGDAYQDRENEAAILLREDNTKDQIILEGSIGPSLVIKPIPERISEILTTSKQEKSSSTTEPSNVNDDEMFLDADGELSAEVSIDTGLPIKRQQNKPKTHQHIIYKKAKDPEEDLFSDYAFMEPDHISKRYRRSTLNATHSRNKREAPRTIYPEILVIVDYDGYRLHGGDNLLIKRYFVSFWNGVDLRYRLLKGPKIQISIAGIIISRGRDATPYLERNRVGRDAIDSAAALTDMGKYLFKERRLPMYDIAVAITKYDMCRRRKGGRCTKGTAGFAYVGGACVVNKRLEKVNSVAIIEDTGGFSGIIVAAHEVGHLLGAVHDGSPPPSYLGGPGAEKCKWTDGYIMSDLRHTERGFRWSPCSIQSFHHFLNGETATCLYNSPHEDGPNPRVLPGKLLTLDAQCRKDRGTSACFKDDRVCAQLFCFDAGSGYCVAYRPAAEGSACGDGQYCLNGRCVAEHENIIPDYSQNTPSYLRRDGGSISDTLYSVNAVDKYREKPQVESYYFSQQYPTNPPVVQQQQYTTTKSPVYYNQNFASSTTRKPYSYVPFSTTTTTTTTTRPSYSYFQGFTSPKTSTTRSPYSFFRNDYFSTTTTTKSPYFTTSTPPPFVSYSQTTKNPYVGDYYLLKQRTTINPYDFRNFGKAAVTNDNNSVNSNYLKRSYSSSTFFSQGSIPQVVKRNMTGFVFSG